MVRRSSIVTAPDECTKGEGEELLFFMAQTPDSVERKMLGELHAAVLRH